MKLEIEITEEEIRSAIERKVRVAVADQTNTWSTDTYIRDRVKEHWQSAVDTMVSELLGSSAALQEKIDKAVEARIKARVAAALRAAA